MGIHTSTLRPSTRKRLAAAAVLQVARHVWVGRREVVERRRCLRTLSAGRWRRATAEELSACFFCCVCWLFSPFFFIRLCAGSMLVYVANVHCTRTVRTPSNTFRSVPRTGHRTAPFPMTPPWPRSLASLQRCSTMACLNDLRAGMAAIITCAALRGGEPFYTEERCCWLRQRFCQRNSDKAPLFEK